MPLRGQIRMSSCKTIGLDYYLVATARASAATGSISDARLPLMVICLGTLPPDLSSASGFHIIWRQSCILGGVPLFRQFRVSSGQAV